jgi:hypothetical protein
MRCTNAAPVEHFVFHSRLCTILRGTNNYMCSIVYYNAMCRVDQSDLAYYRLAHRKAPYRKFPSIVPQPYTWSSKTSRNQIIIPLPSAKMPSASFDSVGCRLPFNLGEKNFPTFQKQRSLPREVDAALYIQNRISRNTCSNLPLPPSDVKNLFQENSEPGLQIVCTVILVYFPPRMSGMHSIPERVWKTSPYSKTLWDIKG